MTPTASSSSAATSVDLPVPERALAIGAHPDDIEFQCGATLAKWAAAGCEVHHLVLTDGSKGSWEPAEDLDALVATRQHEQRAAARALGATGQVVFLGRVDGELDTTLATQAEVAAWIRRLRPNVVLGHDPWKRYRLHPDHRAAGFLTVDGVVAARDPHFFPEQGLAHHRPDALLLFEADEPDHYETVDEAAVAAKLAGLECHVSQFRTTMYVEPDDDGTQLEAFRTRIRDRLAETGAEAGLGPAERYKLIAPL
jgi:LmbE family N-acetylglucosaminyl deacetylase